MPVRAQYGLEQARIQLPSIVAQAHAGIASIITKHGRPVAAIVPLSDMGSSQKKALATPSLLALRGTGQGLWGPHSGQTLQRLRDEWDGA